MSDFEIHDIGTANLIKMKDKQIRLLQDEVLYLANRVGQLRQKLREKEKEEDEKLSDL